MRAWIVRKHWLELLRRARDRAFASLGTNIRGFLYLSVFAVLLAFLIYIGLSWLRNGRVRAAALKAFDTWDSVLAPLIAAVIILLLLTLRFLILTIYEDHVAETRRAERAEQDLAALRSTATGPHQVGSSSVSKTNPQSVYPSLEAIEKRIHRELLEPWINGYMQITQLYRPYEDPVYLFGGPQVRRSMSQERRVETERARAEQHELRQKRKQDALDQAVESLARLERELGLAYLHLQPALRSARKDAIECMKLTEAERLSDRSAFAQAEYSANQYIPIKDLPTKITNPVGGSRFASIYTYVSDLLKKLATYDCGVSAQS